MIWVLQSEKEGENNQILALARAAIARFGCPLKIIRLGFLPSMLWLSLTRRVGFFGLEPHSLEALSPPWPKLVISTGLYNEPVARQVKALSGGRTKLVMLGRTWASYDHFDLIVTTPQYRLPRRPNILHNLTTLHSYDRVALNRASLRARKLWPELKPPYIAVLVGGRSGPFMFGKHAAARLAQTVNEMAQAMKASVLVTTSSRTDLESAFLLDSLLKVPYRFYLRQTCQGENPYPAMLGAAARIIVTGDSIAMLSEAVATGNPVYIFDLGAGYRTMKPGYRLGSLDRNLSTEAYNLLMAIGPKALSRDIKLMHQLLVDSGHAAWLDDDKHAQFKLAPEALEVTLKRIGEWF